MGKIKQRLEALEKHSEQVDDAPDILDTFYGMDKWPKFDPKRPRTLADFYNTVNQGADHGKS